MDTSCGAPARLQKQLRLWGIVTIPLTIISVSTWAQKYWHFINIFVKQFGIAVGLDTFIQNPALGGWYIAIITFCTAMFALVPRSRYNIYSSDTNITIFLIKTFLQGHSNCYVGWFCYCMYPWICHLSCWWWLSKPYFHYQGLCQSEQYSTGWITCLHIHWK